MGLGEIDHIRCNETNNQNLAEDHRNCRIHRCGP